MKKFIQILCVISLCLFALSSCSNILTERQENRFFFELGESVSEKVVSAIEEVKDINEIDGDKEIAVDIVCSIIRNKKNIDSITKTVLLSEVESAEFSFDNLRFSNDYEVNVEIFYKGNKLFNGDSNTFVIDGNEQAPAVNILLDKTYASITYCDPESGSPANESMGPNVYFISSDVKLPMLDPIETGAEAGPFAGWYLKDDPEQKIITGLGASQFLGDVELCPLWKDETLPGEVTDLKVQSDDSKVKLTWKKPNDADFAKVIIRTTDEDGNKVGTELEVLKNEIDQTATIENLINGKKYTFNIFSVDENGNESNAVPKVWVPNAIYSCQDVVDGNLSAGSIVRFGDWPQTVKAEDVIVDTSASSTDIHGWSCYLGNDNNYYVKIRMKQYSSDADQHPGDGDGGYLERKGFKAEPNPPTADDDHWFKIEPIEWKVLKHEYQYGIHADGAIFVPDNGKLLVTNKALLTGQFSINNKNINYENSDIRTLLNGADFKNKAFSNNKLYMLKENVNANSDQVFLLDIKEDKGESVDKPAPNDPEITDYAYSEGVRWKWIMTRSPSADPSDRFLNGSSYCGSDMASNSGNGIVLPAIVIN